MTDDGGNEAEWEARSKANAELYEKAEIAFLQNVETVERTCRFCGRSSNAVCMNTREMDRDDGLNNDPVCNAKLVELGGGERAFVALPEGSKLGEFKPCVISNNEIGLTEVLLEDAMIVWCSLPIPGADGHCVDLGYDQNGRLIGVKIWASVSTREQLEALRGGRNT